MADLVNPSTLLGAELPLTEAHLARLLAHHRLNARGMELVRSIRESPPVRSPASRAGNVTGAYPSRKMGRTLNYESYVELSFIMEFEFDPAVHECYDQPHQLTLRYAGKGGRLATVRHTPDFFVIGDPFVGFEELKSEDALARLVRERPGRWSRSADGTFRCIPAEEAAAVYGLGYRVRSSLSFSRTLLDNLAFLQDYRAPSSPAVGEDETQRIRDVVGCRLGLTLEELIHDTGAPDSIYWLIASGAIFVDLARTLLSHPDLVHVFLDEQSSRVWMAALASEVGRQESFDPRAPLSDDAALALHSASEADRDVALQRFETIRPILESSCRLADVQGTPRRTVQSWVAGWRSAELAHQCGLLGLLPRTRCRGNRVPRLEPELYALMNQVVEDIYERPPHPPMTDAYAELHQRCESSGFTTPSYRCFVQCIKARPRRRQKTRRDGHAAAVADSPAIPSASPGFAPHGQRPFDLVHIDHTQLDLFLSLGGFTSTRPERAWLTIANCAWSRMPVGYALSFDKPSYGSCMQVLRDVARRCERMPRVVMVDNASEFHSKAFDQLLAAYCVEKRHRPPSEPRHGAVCERLFGIVNTQFIHTLSGNTQHLRDPRGMSSEVDPRRHVVWTLPELDRCLAAYLFDIYPSQPHWQHGATPQDRYTQGLELTGQRLHRRVQYDQKFYVLSLPPSPRGTATVDRRKGIQVDCIRYNAEALSALAGKKVYVRVDPEDAGHVYVQASLGASSIECRSEHYRILHGCSRRQLRLATLAVRGQHRRADKTPRTTAAVLAPFLSGVRRDEALQRQRLRDAARRPSTPPSALSEGSAVPPLSGPVSREPASDTPSPVRDEALVSWSDLPTPKEAL